MNEGSTLKVREYLASGLPVYAGHTDCFPDEFPFFQTGSAKISDILGFVEKIKKYSKKQIAKQSEPYISKSDIMVKTYQQLYEISKKNEK